MSDKTILVYLFLCLVLQPFVVDGQPDNDVRDEIIKEVEYVMIKGLAEITQINVVKNATESELNYDEYQVLFRFIPANGEEVLKILADKEMEIKISYKNSEVAVGPAFIKQMKIKKGTRYSMNLYQTRNINVRRYFFKSKAIENDLFVLYDLLVKSLCNKLTSDDLTILKINKLSDAEQNALIDAEIKNGLNNSALKSRKIAKSALQFLHKNKKLLHEYEAALRVLSAKEEDIQRKYELKVQLKKEKKAITQAKIDALKEGFTLKQTETEIVRGCEYDVLPGLAEVSSIRLVKKGADSKWNYDEYEILFRFIPMEGHKILDNLKNKDLIFFLHHRGEKIPAGPEYIKQKNVKAGTRYAMTLYQKKDITACTEQYTYESKSLSNDLFEAFPPRPYFGTLKAKLDKLEQENKEK